MSMIDTMDLVELEEQQKHSSDFGVIVLLNEWEDLVNELSEKEVALYEWKEIYQIKALEIENTTDFKSLYGANNQKIRDAHIKRELQTWADNIKELEFSINYIARRISFLKELIKCKRALYQKEQLND